MSPSTRCTPSERNPQERITSSTPWPRSQSSMNERNGRPARGITGLGVVYVSGLSLVPSPPARTSACTCLPAYSFVGEARRGQTVLVEEVPPVDDEGGSHPALDVPAPIELLELGPLGDQNHGVGAVERLDGAGADPGVSEDPARAVRGHRVIDADVCTLSLQPPGKDEAGRLADVVRVRLESHSQQRDLLPHERPQVLLELA